MTEQPTIRVMIVDDHEMVREGLAMFLKSCDDLDLVANVDSGEEAVRQYVECKPDVILMDLIMPGGAASPPSRPSRKNGQTQD